MKKKILIFILCMSLCLLPVHGKEKELIQWVDFNLSYAALQKAMTVDIESQGTEQPLSWIDLLAFAATRTGGRSPSVKEIDNAAQELRSDSSAKELLKGQYKYFAYYKEAYGAALGGLLGSYAIEMDGEWVPAYGLKAFSPIAAGYGYNHYEDFGNRRSYGFARRHLGNDLMGSQGTPIIAVEGGTIEAMGWNQYGGWRIGIRSHDSLRYYYYAHLQKDHPFAEGLEVGQQVCAGEVIGFMGRTGYSTKENVNNIDTVHLHFGIQLVFDESQKECDNEIWINPYHIVRLLSGHRSTVIRKDGKWQRLYPYRDLDKEP